MTFASSLFLLDTLASYVPAMVLRQLANPLVPRGEPSAERLPVAVLFADISGFTPLTERFAQRGPAGAEELSRLLNAYFDKLIDLITIHGGDIIKFAGDAVPAVWPAEKEDLETVTLRAAQCALDIQNSLSQYQVAPGLQLSLHMGIGAGEVLAASVGGVLDRWEFLVAGDPLAQISAAERQAKPGQVVLAPEAWALVQAGYIGQQLPQGGILLEAQRDEYRLPFRPLFSHNPPADSETFLRGFVPGAILARLDAGQTGWLAELRRVTVLFVNVTGLDYQAADALERVQAVMRALQKVLYHYEGSVNQFIVDDKGTTLVAALGLPPLTHEDDAARGIQAALDMHTVIKELALNSTIGVTTGQVFCGGRGNETRREYAMIGDIVNLSARLMVAAGKLSSEQDLPILCDKATYQGAKTRLALEALPSIQVKGKADLIAIYRPYDQTHVLAKTLWSFVHPPAAMVGRSAERNLLIKQLDALVQDDQDSLVIIEGDAGIGKSRLVGELLDQANAINVVKLIGAGDAIEQSSPYHAWRSVFRQLFDLPERSDNPDAQRQHILDWLQSSEIKGSQGPELLQLAPLLNTVLPWDLPENEITRQMDGQVRADNIRNLLVRLFQAAANQTPTLLVLEDAHWLDSASWALALAVGQRVRPLAFVIATRPINDPQPLEYRQLLGASHTQHILLEGLSSRDVVALVSQQLGVPSLPDPVIKLILEKAQGNPFFSEELAYALRDAGMIEIIDGQCRIALGAGDLSAISLPDTVQGIITSRIDRLAPSQQLALKVASVIGRVFAFRLLRDIYPIDTDKAHLSEYMTTLQQLDMTPLDRPEPDRSYIFKHIITQEVAYNLMLFSQRRQLHRAVAEWYEYTHTDDLSSFYPLLAHHWSKAKDAPKTIEYADKAGEQALRTYANREAIRFFKQALEWDAKAELETPLLQRVRWHRQLAQAHLGLGQLAESRSHFEQTLALLDYPAPTTRSQMMLSMLNQAFIQLAHLMERSSLTQRPPVVRRDSPQEEQALLLEAARAFGGLAQIYFYANETVLNLYTNLYSLNLAQEFGPSPELTQSYANACIAAGLVPLHPLAGIYGRRAREVAAQLEHLPSSAWVLLITAVYDTGVGQWDEAQGALTETIQIAERIGDRRRWQQAMNTLATVLYLKAEFASSAELFADLYTVAHHRNDVQYRAYGLLGQARCLLALGRLDGAMNFLQEVKSLLTGKLGRVEEIYTHGLLALALLRQGNLPASLKEAKSAAGLIAQSRPISYNLIDAYAAIAQVHLAAWETKLLSVQTDSQIRCENATLGRQACKAMQGFARVFPIGRPRAWLYQGVYHYLAGQQRSARRAWYKGLSHAERLGMSFEQGLIHYEIGRHLPTEHVARQAHLELACAIFNRLDARYDLKRVQNILEAT